MLSLEQTKGELARLYNHADDDSRQFTRHQMMVAIRHGYRLASEGASGSVEDRLAAIESELGFINPGGPFGGVPFYSRRDRDAAQRGPEGAEAEGQQPGPQGIAQPGPNP